MHPKISAKTCFEKISIYSEEEKMCTRYHFSLPYIIINIGIFSFMMLKLREIV